MGTSRKLDIGPEFHEQNPYIMPINGRRPLSWPSSVIGGGTSTPANITRPHDELDKLTTSETNARSVQSHI